MERITENLIRCPACKNGFCVSVRFGEPVFTCQVCKAAFPIKSGVIDMVPDLFFKKTVAQRFMESQTIVSVYESRLWRRNFFLGLGTGIQFNREAKIITDAAMIKDADSVLDLACGPGIYTRPFARAIGNGRVVGLDLSMPMLKWGAKKIKQEGLDNVVYIRASAMDLPFEDESFDAVNCCGALHLFPDTDKALSEISRVLAPGGRFTTAVFRAGKGLGTAPIRAYWRKMGVDSYTRKGLTGVLSEKGFSSAICHHAAGLWMIMSAHKK